jgi:hypothetical protein
MLLYSREGMVLLFALGSKILLVERQLQVVAGAIRVGQVDA